MFGFDDPALDPHKQRWFIAKRKNNKTYYLSEQDDQSNMWVADREDAKFWFSENYIHKYVNDRLSGREDVFFVCEGKDS